MNTNITAGHVLRAKGYGFHGIGPDSSAYDALEMMAEKNVGALPVLENGLLIGVFSERDYARKVILKGKASKKTAVREVMSSPPIHIDPGTSLRECMVLMTKNRIRHLPVLDKGVLLGIISIGDAVNAVISEQQATIEELEGYIAGSGYQ